MDEERTMDLAAQEPEEAALAQQETIEEAAAPEKQSARQAAEEELTQARDELQAAEQEAPGEEPAPDAPERVTVVDIRFRSNAKTYFFDPGELRPEAGDHVIIETARGDEYGICAGACHEVRTSEIVTPLRKVLRMATAQDERVNQENQEKEKRAFEVCQQKIADHKLEMQLVSAEAAFDGSKILFFFTADGRVDFRELVKDLASAFRTRIELRQIGVRDKAKMVGGLGVCGRPFCCKEFLDDFQPVSIKMAKTQNLSLNPTKISGTCGRLMCCLKYEQEAYEDLLKTAPKNESFVDTPDGRGTVTEVNLLRQCVKVRMEESPETIGCYKNCDICVLRNGKARKNDPPIPKDLAPISSKPRKVQPKEDAFEPLPELIYPDQVSSFDQESMFAAKKELFEPVQQPSEAAAAPEQPEEERAGEKQPRRRSRRRRGKGTDGAQEAKPQTQNAPDKPAEKQPEARRDKRPNEQKPRQPRPNGEKKPQSNKQPGQKPQTEKPQGEKPEANPDALKRPRRRRYRGNKPGTGNGQAPKQGE